MLEIKNVTKVYQVGDLRQVALDDVSVSFRKNEFASILGPSGSGKTTLLNIIGGLDKYTSGDLIINNISTKKYKDSDWDSYRNHRIGFVFQSYNLISHQTVLKNVSLAMTISGVSKKAGIEKAKQALIDVGLEEHMYKKPNQLSGGQMQRVAIARALVNDPDIVLADEPTGALDSETSIQIMNILKNIAKDKLVIMVTHNPDIANEYSNRIIKLKDGKIISDSNPFNDNKKEKDSIFAKTKKTTMSYLTALGLSFNNLMTKKGRTILTALAGSIGIIGIALILSLSTGFQAYIDKIQEDTMSSYPLTIQSETADMSSLLLSMISEDENIKTTKSNKLIEKQFVSEMFSSISKNDLRSFKSYLEKNYDKVKNDLTSVKYTYSVDPLIYTKDFKKDVIQVNPNSMVTSMYSGFGGMTSLFSSYSSIFYQMVDDREALDEQYDVVAGHWPEQYNEMVIVLSQQHMIPDFILYFLGYRDMEELYDVMTKVMSGETVELHNTPMELTYDQIMDTEFKLIDPNKLYKYNSKYKIYEDMSEDEDYVSRVYNNSEKLKISGIVIAKDGVNSRTLQPGIAYTADLINHIIDKSTNSELVKKQLKNKDIDVFSNTSFDEKKEKTGLEFEDLITIDKEMLSSAFGMEISEEDITKMTQGYMGQISSDITTDISPAKKDLTNALKDLATNMFNDYIENPKQSVPNPMNPSTKIAIIHTSDVEDFVKKFLSKETSKETISNLEKNYVIPSSVYNDMFKSLLGGLMNGYIAVYNQMDKSFTQDENNMGAPVMQQGVETTVNGFMSQAEVEASSELMAGKMTEAVMQKNILTKVGELTGKLMQSVASGFKVDPNKIAKAFKFDLTEDELKRIMSAMMGSDNTSNAQTNLLKLGYQDKDEPTMISLYFKDFDSKERVLEFIDNYNEAMEKLGETDKTINYTDAAGILMSSVKKIVNSISYALIAFVSISLVVSSIMIGIITYISVLERTKEIGILRAIGASKRNISSIFNAETFIIGLLSGLLGIGISLLCIPIINYSVHKLTDNYDINAILPISGAILLVILSIILTIIGGLIPAKKASKQDPVIALRTE